MDDYDSWIETVAREATEDPRLSLESWAVLVLELLRIIEEQRVVLTGHDELHAALPSENADSADIAYMEVLFGYRIT